MAHRNDGLYLNHITPKYTVTGIFLIVLSGYISPDQILVNAITTKSISLVSSYNVNHITCIGLLTLYASISLMYITSPNRY